MTTDPKGLKLRPPSTPTLADLDALDRGKSGVRCFALGTPLATAHILNWPLTSRPSTCPVCRARIDLGMHPLSTEPTVSHD